MASYRKEGITKIKAAKKIKLSHSGGRKLEKSLDKARMRYEKLLYESFENAYLHHYRITIFGSAKIENIHSEEFRFVSNLTHELGKNLDVDIVTGGGGGLMLAASTGLYQAMNETNGNARNQGVLMDLPNQGDGELNPFLDVTDKFHCFTTRLEEFVRSSNGIYLAPGGIGTALEAALFIQLKQKGKVEKNFPILAHPFWKPIFENENKLMYSARGKQQKERLLEEKDLNIVKYTDDISEVVKIFKKDLAAWKKLEKKVVYSK
jgi:hypothetical protein